jgi:hypothetical protein
MYSKKNISEEEKIMKLEKSVIFFLAFLCIIFIFGGCKRKEVSSLKIVKMGPTPIKAGQDFNVQPDGVSAIWVDAENATKTTVVVWGEKQLKSAVRVPDLVTAVVPKELFSKPGKFQIYLLETKTGAKSNSIVLTVEE